MTSTPICDEGVAEEDIPLVDYAHRVLPPIRRPIRGVCGFRALEHMEASETGLRAEQRGVVCPPPAQTMPFHPNRSGSGEVGKDPFPQPKLTLEGTRGHLRPAPHVLPLHLQVLQQVLHLPVGESRPGDGEESCPLPHGQCRLHTPLPILTYPGLSQRLERSTRSFCVHHISRAGAFIRC